MATNSWNTSGRIVNSRKSKESSVQCNIHKVFEEMSPFEFQDLQGLTRMLPQHPELPRIENNLRARVCAVLSLFHQQIPLSNAASSETLNSPDLTTALRCLLALRFLAYADMATVLKEDASGQIEEALEKEWSQIIKWMRYLLTNAHNVIVGSFNPLLLQQVVIGYVCALLLDIFQSRSFSEKAIGDPNVVAMVLTAFLEQDVRIITRMDNEVAFSSGPALALSWTIAYCLPPFATSATVREFISVLDSHEQTIVHLALLHLRCAQSMAPVVTGSKTLIKIGASASLLNILIRIKSFSATLATTRVTATVTASLRLIVDDTTVSPSHPHKEPLLFSQAVVSLLNILYHDFTEPTLAKFCIQAALSKRIEYALIALSPIEVYGQKSNQSQLLQRVLRQLASYTVYRSVNNSIVTAVGRAFKKTIGLTRSAHIGKFWLELHRMSLERTVCKYLFCELYRRCGRKCWGCRSRFSRLELKICSQCNAAAYCSRACQTAAWRTHKSECSHLKRDVNANHSTFGRDEALVISFIALLDLNRLIVGVCDILKSKNPDFTFDSGYFRIDYTLSIEATGAAVSYVPLSAEQAKSLKSSSSYRTMSNLYDSVSTGQAKLFFVEIKLPYGNDTMTIRDYIPIYEYMLELAYDPNHPMRSDLPWSEADEQYRRVLCCLRGRFDDMNVTALTSIPDIVDSIMAEIQVVTTECPGWGILRRIKCSFVRVEQKMQGEGRELNNIWIF